MNLGPEKCNPCSKSFLSKESMQIHFCKIHKNGTHHCHVCKAVYVSQNDLENHYETIHENPELHQCLICKISFINDYSLQKHIQTTKHKQSVHEEKNLENTKTDSQTILDQIDIEMDEECDKELFKSDKTKSNVQNMKDKNVPHLLPPITSRKNPFIQKHQTNMSRHPVDSEIEKQRTNSLKKDAEVRFCIWNELVCVFLQMLLRLKDEDLKVII